MMARAQTMANSMERGKGARSGGGGGGRRNGGQKRRPVDPEETGSVPAAPYPERRPRPKRPRTIDDVLGSLSLRASDPPGNSFCSKRKGDGAGGPEDGRRSAKAPRSHAPGAGAGASPSVSEEGERGSGARPDPEGRKGGPPTGATSRPFDWSISRARRGGEASAKSDPGDDADATREMSVDDVDRESDGSVSEGSIRDAMYHLVFGRRNHPPLPSSVGAGGGGRYDAVDARIEDIIRRSRLRAVIGSRNDEGGEDAPSDAEMDAEIADGDDEEWNPGHG